MHLFRTYENLVDSKPRLASQIANMCIVRNVVVLWLQVGMRATGRVAHGREGGDGESDV